MKSIKTKNQKPKTKNSFARQSTVWTFTNQRQLNKKEFIDYIERKVFRTIRKFNMLPKNKIITLKKQNDLNTTILKKILEKKFQVKLIPTIDHRPSTIDSANLSQIAEDIFKKILKGNFTHTPTHPHTNTPLLYLSGKELELYAKLTNTKGTKRKQNKKIQTLFNKFLKKNQDLELNILKATNQLKW